VNFQPPYQKQDEEPVKKSEKSPLTTTERQITCLNNHVLSRVNNLYQLYPNTGSSYEANLYFCETCRGEFNCQYNNTYHCKTCNFDLCPSCYQKAQKISQVSCPKSHPLLIVSGLEGFSNYPHNFYYCNACGVTFDSAQTPSAHCQACRYDLCPNCLLKKQENPIPNKKSAHEKPALKTSGNSSSEQITCPQKHPITPTSNLRQLHPNTGGSYDDNQYFCDTCERRFNCRVDNSYHCKICYFDLCPSCYQKDQKINFDCPAGHSLYIVSSLRCFNKRTHTYTENIYGCDSCRANFSAEFNPSCHCRECEYDLCPLCFETKKREVRKNSNESKPVAVVQIQQPEEAKVYHEEIVVKRPEEAKINKVEVQRKDIQEVKREKVEPEKVQKPTEPEKKEVQNEMLCVVCLDAQRSHLFTPCMHICTCAKCSSYIVSKQSGCPICRNPIQSSIKVYMS